TMTSVADSTSPSDVFRALALAWWRFLPRRRPPATLSASIEGHAARAPQDIEPQGSHECLVCDRRLATNTQGGPTHLVLEPRHCRFYARSPAVPLLELRRLLGKAAIPHGQSLLLILQPYGRITRRAGLLHRALRPQRTGRTCSGVEAGLIIGPALARRNRQRGVPGGALFHLSFVVENELLQRQSRRLLLASRRRLGGRDQFHSLRRRLLAIVFQPIVGVTQHLLGSDPAAGGILQRRHHRSAVILGHLSDGHMRDQIRLQRLLRRRLPITGRFLRLVRGRWLRSVRLHDLDRVSLALVGVIGRAGIAGVLQDVSRKFRIFFHPQLFTFAAAG